MLISYVYLETKTGTEIDRAQKITKHFGKLNLVTSSDSDKI